MKYVIAGFGKFGRIAFERISKSFPAAGLVIVEPDESKTRDLGDPCQILDGDVIQFLFNDSSLEDGDIVIPMVPFHLAASYVFVDTGARAIPLPHQLEKQLPNPYRLDESNLFVSRADFICPNDCPEGDLCTVTRLPRSPLYSALEELHTGDWKISVQRSFQILPGVGGYPLGDLRLLKHRLATGTNIIATVCKCHGILTGVEVF